MFVVSLDECSDRTQHSHSMLDTLKSVEGTLMCLRQSRLRNKNRSVTETYLQKLSC